MASLPIYSPDSNDVSFIIPVKNDAIRLRNCLLSICRLEPHDIATEILVADNGSEDDSAKVAEQAGAQVLELPDLTVSQLRNRAARQARGEFIAFVDADHHIDPGWLKRGLSALSDDTVVAAGSPYWGPEKPTWVQRAYNSFRVRRSVTADVEWLASGNLLIKKHAFFEVGGFDETLETCEDVDLCNRLRKAGYRIVEEPGMKSIHSGDPRTLSALFWGELWRGRNNLRVTLRGPLSLRALPSLLIPVAVLTLLLISMTGLAAMPKYPDSWRLTFVSICGVLIAAILRTIRMERSAASHAHLVQFLIVASVYEVARALSLIIPVRHAVRRRRA